MADFAKRHYEQVAKVLRSSKPVPDEDDPLYKTGGYTWTEHKKAMAQWENVCLAFLNMFKTDNPSFDRGQFLRACKGETK